MIFCRMICINTVRGDLFVPEGFLKDPANSARANELVNFNLTNLLKITDCSHMGRSTVFTTAVQVCQCSHDNSSSIAMWCSQVKVGRYSFR